MRSAALHSGAGIAARSSTCVTWAGALAHPALIRSDGVTQPVPGFESTPFRLAAGTLVWIGCTGPLHPRTVLVNTTPADAAPLMMDADTQYSNWRWPETVGTQGFEATSAAKTASRAALGVMADYKPAGLALLLTGAALPFPLSHRAVDALALTRACASNDVTLFAQSATRLLGAGSGLTPSGDDFVGGALFARRGTGADAAWRQAAQDIVARAQQRTHVISAALLADLAAGHSYAALHSLAAAVADADETAATRHASALVRIGASSGWDMLAGFIAGLCGTLNLHTAASPARAPATAQACFAPARNIHPSSPARCTA